MGKSIAQAVMIKKISIITITFNSDKYLEQTITSVLNQTYKNIEYIIIDGGSTDATVDIIKKYESNIDQWVSEPDKGIADAMNKGVSMATGDYILFLHSDDYLLHSEVLADAAPSLAGASDIVMFNIILKNKDIATVHYPRGFTWWINFKTGIFHQSVFCSSILFQKIGCFDTSFRIAMDYDFFLRAYRNNIQAKHVNVPLSLMRLVGISSLQDWSNVKERLYEERRVHIKNCNTSLLHILYTLYWIVYLPYKKICSPRKSV